MRPVVICDFDDVLARYWTARKFARCCDAQASSLSLKIFIRTGVPRARIALTG
jgi:hypothetical protein